MIIYKHLYYILQKHMNITKHVGKAERLEKSALDISAEDAATCLSELQESFEASLTELEHAV